MMQALIDLVQARPFIAPGSYFSEKREWWHGVFALMFLGTILSIVQVVISLLNGDVLRAAAEAWKQLAATSRTPPIEAQQGYNPWRPLLLPYYWMLYVLVGAIVRMGASRLQRLQISLLECMGLTAWSATPILFIGALLGAYALVVPYAPDHYPLARIYIMTVVLLVGWIWEAIIFITALKQAATSESTGQSIFIWLSPVLLLLVLISVYVFIAAATL